MRLLMIGDIVGSPGRDIVRAKLPALIAERQIDFVVANGENAASGSGILPAHVKELTAAGIDVITTGDHIWKKAQIADYINTDPRLLRPANYPPDAAGRGLGLFTARNGAKVGVINLIGRVYLGPADCPFRVGAQAVRDLAEQTPLILIDIHAEATSEKVALGWYLDSRVTAIVGTHTHVPTADEEVLEGGTGYITDLGMTGPYDSVIGMRKEEVLHRFRAQRPAPFVAATGDVRLCGAIFDVDPETGRCTAVERVCERLP